MVSSGAIMPARAPPSMDILHTVMRSSIDSARIAGPRVFKYAAGAAADADARDERQDDVLGGDARAQRAIHAHLKRLRFALQQALRGQHVLDFAGADAERQRAECAVRGGVAIAADHGHAGLRQAQFGPMTCTMPCWSLRRP